MIRFTLPIAAATAATAAIFALAPNTAVQAAEVQIASSGPVVELTVTEQVKAAPDIADISAGVTTQAMTAVEAMRLNAREMTAVIARMRSLGIAEDDIQTTGINLNAQYDYDRENQRQVFRGYQVSNRVSVTVREVQDIGPILDALVAAGTTDLSGPSFRIDDDSAAKAQAREAALQTAMARAGQYAGWAGYSGVRLLEVSENIASSQPRPMMRSMAMAESADVSTPVQPGQVSTGVTLTVKYEMVR